jgi:hypothetical protein
LVYGHARLVVEYIHWATIRHRFIRSNSFSLRAFFQEGVAMSTPNEDTLHHLNRLKHQAASIDQPLLAGELRQIVHDYNAWLNGDWSPTEGELRGYFAERFAMARHYAHAAGERCMAISLSAVEDEVLQ